MGTPESSAEQFSLLLDSAGFVASEFLRISLCFLEAVSILAGLVVSFLSLSLFSVYKHVIRFMQTQNLDLAD